MGPEYQELKTKLSDIYRDSNTKPSRNFVSVSTVAYFLRYCAKDHDRASVIKFYEILDSPYEDMQLSVVYDSGDLKKKSRILRE
jgi:hypothetical protein